MARGIILPWIEAPDFQYEISMDREVYILRQRWNDLAKAWALDIFSRARTPIVLGARLVAGADVLVGINVAAAPRGGLVVVGEEPAYDSFRERRSYLVYLPPEVTDAL